MTTARFIFAEHAGDGPTKTQGTKVVLDDGQELTGIQKVVLTATPNDFWKAELTILVKVEGIVEAEVTALHDTERRFEQGEERLCT